MSIMLNQYTFSHDYYFLNHEQTDVETTLHDLYPKYHVVTLFIYKLTGRIIGSNVSSSGYFTKESIIIECNSTNTY